MVKKLFFSILFLSLNLHAVEEKSLRSIAAGMAFEIPIQSPSFLTLCENQLWAFSEANLDLEQFDPNTGNLKNKYPIQNLYNSGSKVDVSALTCQGNRLLVLMNGEDKGVILEIQTEPKVQLLKTFPLPMKQRATDLFCNLTQCWILQERPMTTFDLKKWSEVWAPFPDEMKKVYAHPDLNPFEDWQATLNLAKGKYTRGAIDKYGQFVLLDLFHSQAIIRTGAEWQKWGSFGAWEGSFLAPKAITFVAENTLAVADAKLKAVFLFRRDGMYLGVLSLGASQVFSPGYPLGLAVYEGRLFVSDFFSNKIFALDLRFLSSQVETAEAVTVRKNLFRREEVLKDSPSALCLNCHDGTISNQLHKYVVLKHHHPLECSQCHDPHHILKSQHYLKLPTPRLCQSCHKEYSDPKVNHLWAGAKKTGGSCMDCHRGHTNNSKILIQPVPEMCVSCHKNQVIQHKPVSDIADVNLAKSVQLENGKINCLTCHQTHINWKETHFIRDPQKILTFCSSCHGAKSPLLFKDFHKIMKCKNGGHP